MVGSLALHGDLISQDPFFGLLAHVEGVHVLVLVLVPLGLLVSWAWPWVVTVRLNFVGP